MGVKILSKTGTVSLTGDRAQGDDSKSWAYSSIYIFDCYLSGTVTWSVPTSTSILCIF